MRCCSGDAHWASLGGALASGDLIDGVEGLMGGGALAKGSSRVRNGVPIVDVAAIVPEAHSPIDMGAKGDAAHFKSRADTARQRSSNVSLRPCAMCYLTSPRSFVNRPRSQSLPGACPAGVFPPSPSH